MALDVLTMGRGGVDIYPLQSGVGLAEVTSFANYLGGSPTNVAVAAARYGRAAAVVTKTGADPFGEFVRAALTGYGVDTAHVGVSPGLPTPVTFCEIFLRTTSRCTSTASPRLRIWTSRPRSWTWARSARQGCSG